MCCMRKKKKGKEEGRRKFIYPTTAEPVTKVPFTGSFSGAGEVGSLWNFVVIVAFFHSPSPRSLFMHSLTRIKHSSQQAGIAKGIQCDLVFVCGNK